MLRCRFLLSVVLIVLVGTASAHGQARKSGKSTKGADKEEHTLSSLKDGWPIHVTFYPSRLKQNAAVVVLLHMKGSNRLVWTRKGGLAESLQSKGFAVIAADLRKHGQSKRTSIAPSGGKAGKKKRKRPSSTNLIKQDYELMVTSDMEAIKKFIYLEHQKRRLNMRKMAIIAAGMSAPVAVVFAARDWQKPPHPDAPTLAARTPRGQDVRALLLLSPDASVPGLPTNTALKYMKTRAAFLVCVGNSKARGPLSEANKVYNQLKPVAKDPEKRTRWFNPFSVQLQGTNLLGKRIGVEKTLLAFLERYVSDLKIPWRDRRSRANRDD